MSESGSQSLDSRSKRVLALTVSMAILLLLALLNRKLPLAALSEHALGVLRLRDVFTLFLLTPAGVAIMWLYLDNCGAAAKRGIALLFMLGVLMLGIGFGIHEPMLALSLMGWSKLPDVGESISFFKELPGHWVFFAGMAMTMLSLAMAETSSPLERPLPRWALFAASAAGLAGAVSLFFNEVNDQRTSIDMAVTLACVALIFAAHWRNGLASLAKTPITLTLYLCLGGGAAAVYAVWLFRML